MVHFVLDTHSKYALCLKRESNSIFVKRLDRDLLRARDFAIYARYG